MGMSRRGLLAGGLLAGSTGLVGASPASAVDQRPTAAAPALRAWPFRLGVASGDPTTDGFVIWTRLAPRPLAGDGHGGMPDRPYPVAWEVALDERFVLVVAQGSVVTGPRRAHAVHVEVAGMPSDRELFYRFRVGDHLSPVGRARTTPVYTDPALELTSSLHLAAVACANYQRGFFTVYRHLAEERPDVVLHLGDYVYEAGAQDSPPGRTHVGGEATTLAGYRLRYAQYKTDPDLQAAHAAAPWLVIPDDHEVVNNYAGTVDEDPATTTEVFLRRRRAAYRAYVENMPLRPGTLVAGGGPQLFRRVRWGSLATLHLLDTRQYRDDQACGGGFQDCPDAADPRRTLLGGTQERWLDDGLRSPEPARWDLLTQQVFFGRRDTEPGEATVVSMDAWDGYPAARERAVASWLDAGVRNPVVLSGDVHAPWAGDLRSTPTDPTSPLAASELVCSSVSSGGDGYDEPTGTHPWFAQNPDLRFWTNLRGYLSATVTGTELTARFRCVPFVTERGAPVSTRAEWAIEDGVRGLQEVSGPDGPSQPGPAGLAARRRLPSPAEVVADTLEQETGAVSP